MEIIEKVDNKLLHRKEIVAVVEANTTPSSNELVEEFAKEFKTDKENVVVVYIKGKFGTNKFDIFAKIYNNVESKNTYEVITRKEKKKREEEAKKAAEEAKKAKEEKAKAEEEAKATAEKPAEEQAEQPAEVPTENQEQANPDEEPKQDVKPEGNKPEEAQ